MTIAQLGIASESRRPQLGTGVPAAVMQEFLHDMRLSNMALATIEKRVELLERFRRFLDGRSLLAAEYDDVRRFQRTFEGLAPASVDIYSRHLKAFFVWALGRGLIDTDPAARLILPKLSRGRPHPTHDDDLALIFTATSGNIRLAFALAAFAGLRRGEICAMQRRDLDLSGRLSTLLVHGKGGKERIVPLIQPLVDELLDYGLRRAGYILLRRGKPYIPDQLSFEVHKEMKRLGVETTLHSARHAFATRAARTSRDPLFVRDLLGHNSVATTEIYMATNLDDAHFRLAAVAATAQEYLGRSSDQDTQPLRAVR